MWQARITLLEWSPASSASIKERKQWLKAAVFSASKKSLGITQGMSRRFPQVLHTEKERGRERKRTIAAVKEMEKPQHCIGKRPKLTNDVSLETKAYPEFMFRHKFSLLVISPTQCGRTFFVEKILTTYRILYESKKQSAYGGTKVSGKIPTKWCSHLSERKFSFFVALRSLKKIFGKLTQSLKMCWC